MFHSVPDCNFSELLLTVFSTKYCRKTKIIKNAYVCKRALKMYIFRSLFDVLYTLCMYYYAQFKKYNTNLWGPSFFLGGGGGAWAAAHFALS